MLTFMGMGKCRRGKMDKFERALEAYRPHLLAEEGTVEYIVFRGTKDPLLLAFFEKYIDKAANKAHHASPHLQEFLRILEECTEDNALSGFFEEMLAKR